MRHRCVVGRALQFMRSSVKCIGASLGNFTSVLNFGAGPRDFFIYYCRTLEGITRKKFFQSAARSICVGFATNIMATGAPADFRDFREHVVCIFICNADVSFIFSVAVSPRHSITIFFAARCFMLGPLRECGTRVRASAGIMRAHRLFKLSKRKASGRV